MTATVNIKLLYSPCLTEFTHRFRVNSSSHFIPHYLTLHCFYRKLAWNFGTCLAQTEQEAQIGGVTVGHNTDRWLEPSRARCLPSGVTCNMSPCLLTTCRDGRRSFASIHLEHMRLHSSNDGMSVIWCKDKNDVKPWIQNDCISMHPYSIRMIN